MLFNGVSAAYSKQFIQWSTVDQIPNKSDPIKQDEKLHYIPKHKRLILQDKKTRAYLALFLTDKINATQFDELLLMLKKSKSGINKLLQYLYNNELKLSGTVKKYKHPN